MAVEQNLLKPDVVFYLDLNEEDAAKRGSYGEERLESLTPLFHTPIPDSLPFRNPAFPVYNLCNFRGEQI